MTTEHTVVRSGKSKRKPFNSNVADYLLIIATFSTTTLAALQTMQTAFPLGLHPAPTTEDSLRIPTC
jgi:hypothetical protein